MAIRVRSKTEDTCTASLHKQKLGRGEYCTPYRLGTVDGIVKKNLLRKLFFSYHLSNSTYGTSLYGTKGRRNIVNWSYSFWFFVGF